MAEPALPSCSAGERRRDSQVRHDPFEERPSLAVDRYRFKADIEDGFFDCTIWLESELAFQDVLYFDEVPF